MKKFILAAILLIGSIVAHAQTATQAMVNNNGLALDTASQAAAEGPKTLAVKGEAVAFSIVLVTTKISGTIAGTVAWQGSNDGVNFATISTTALTDASTNYQYKETEKGFLYYKALITQTGTSSLSYKANYYPVPPLK